MRGLKQPYRRAGAGAGSPVAAQPSRLPRETSASPAMLEFLAWVSSRPRTYAETMEAWQTSCPRNSVWEDALHEDLIQLEHGSGSAMGEAGVRLTRYGEATITVTAGATGI